MIYFVFQDVAGELPVIRFETGVENQAEDYCIYANASLAIAGIPTAVSCFYVVSSAGEVLA